MFFEGKKPMLLKSLEKQMNAFAKEKEFEKAGKIKRTIFALNHIQVVSLMKRVDSEEIPGIRIEAYDIAHLSGKNMVGAMVVMEGGELMSSLYRKFVIKGFDKANDPGALSEIVKRRSKHLEWGKPDIVVVDGNQVQLKYAKESLGYQNVLFCSVVKDQTHKAKEILFFDKKAWEKNNMPKKLLQEQIIKINAEVHRFAIAFHKKRRSDSFFG